MKLAVCKTERPIFLTLTQIVARVMAGVELIVWFKGCMEFELYWVIKLDQCVKSIVAQINNCAIRCLFSPVVYMVNRQKINSNY